MDQLKIILGQVRKYHFWVLCGIAVVVPLGLAFTAGGTISRNTKERATAVAAVRTQVVQLRDTQNPPNETAKQVVQKAHERLRDAVYQAWAALYQEQAKRIQWPTALGDEFLGHMRLLQEGDPIGDRDRTTYQYFIRKHIPKLFLDENDLSPEDRSLRLGLNVRMTREEREEYLALIRGRPKPQKKKPPAAADAKPDPSAKPEPEQPAAKSTPPSDAGTTQAAAYDEPQGIVDWDYGLRQELLDRYSWSSPPTSSQVWIAQEDLWVLESLVRILKETNKHATSQYNAPVKAIYALAIGQDAAKEMAASQARIFQGLGGGYMATGYGPAGPAGTPVSGGMGIPIGMPGPPGGGGFTDPSGRPMGPVSGSFTAPSGPAERAMPTTPGGGASGGGSSDMGGGGMGPGRFPMAPSPMSMGTPGAGGPGGQAPGTGMAGLSEDERWAMSLRDYRYVDQYGNPLPYNAPPPFKQFKMIPVHMRLGIDQRELPRLLANCANSDMPVVVRRVAIQPEAGGSGSLSGPLGGVTGAGGSDVGRPRTGSAVGRSQMPGPSPGGFSKGSDFGRGRSPLAGFSGPSGAGAASGDEFSEEIVVEIQGIIYFFNPPEKKALEPAAPSPAQPAGAPLPGAALPAAKS